MQNNDRTQRFIAGLSECFWPQPAQIENERALVVWLAMGWYAMEPYIADLEAFGCVSGVDYAPVCGEDLMIEMPDWLAVEVGSTGTLLEFLERASGQGN